MTTTQTSTTAKGIAAMRAIETEKGAERSICVDPFARRLTTPAFYLLSKWFSGYGERRAPGTQGFVVCRCRYFDDYFHECIRAGIKQIVILGAGLDSRAYRKETIEACVRGFRNIVDADSDSLRQLYCTGENRERTVAGIYAIVYAEVG